MDDEAKQLLKDLVAEVRGLRTDMMSNDGVLGFIQSAAYSLNITRGGEAENISLAQICDELVEASDRQNELLKFLTQMQVLAIRAAAAQGADVHVEAVIAKEAELNREPAQEPEPGTDTETPAQTASPETVAPIAPEAPAAP